MGSEIFQLEKENKDTLMPFDQVKSRGSGTRHTDDGFNLEYTIGFNVDLTIWSCTFRGRTFSGG